MNSCKALVVLQLSYFFITTKAIENPSLLRANAHQQLPHLASLIPEGSYHHPPIWSPSSIVKKNMRVQSASEERYEKLTSWFKAEGGIIHKNLAVGLVPGTNIHGMFARGGPIDNMDTMVMVPPHLAIRVTNALPKVAKAFGKEIPPSLDPREAITHGVILKKLGIDESLIPGLRSNEPSFILLSLYLLLFAQDSNDYFFPYMNAMPSGCQMSVCWSDETTRNVFAPNYAQVIIDQKNRFKKVSEILQLDEVQWLEAVSRVKSRVWGDPDYTDMHILVPIMDMFNHHSGNGGYLKPTRVNGRFTQYNFESSKQIEENEEIFDNYGSKMSAMQKKLYNFEEKGNPKDDCETIKNFTESYQAKLWENGTFIPSATFSKAICAASS